MAAFLLDEEERQEDTQQAETTQQEDFEEPAVQEEQSDDLPDKYKGKSIKEIVQMHQEAEKLAGRHSSEVGELRKIVDDFIVQQTQLKEKETQKPVEEVDFFTDPAEAVRKILDSDPRLKEAQTVSAQMKRATALNELQRNHPDMSDILQDAKFAEWVQGSNVRKRLYEQADKEYDLEAADELFSLWKERKQLVNTTAATEQNNRKQTVKAASTGNAKGTAETNSRKIYRRVDIIKLMKEDPDRYEALSPEIMRAYAEGRVKG